jgi:ERF superfamily
MDNKSTLPPPRRITGPAPRPINTKGLDSIAERQEAPTPAEYYDRPPMQTLQGPVGNLAKAIANVMKQVGTIEKRGVNEFYKYPYMRMEDLLHKLTPLMGENGLAVLQNEIKVEVVEKDRVAVTYEFSIIHESGEIWSEKPRFTGMSNARNRNGSFDDKSVNKAHTAARKYFLLSLFQVPAGDFDDADDGTPQQQVRPQPKGRTRAPVPGPSKERASMVESPSEEIDDNQPYRIVAKGAEAWAEEYIRCIGTAKTSDEIAEWNRLNAVNLNNLNQNYSDIYSRIYAANEHHSRELQRSRHDPETGEIDDPSMPVLPDPMVDVQTAINWVAQQLNELKTYEAAEQFWNTVVAPREGDFDPLDFQVLMGEWNRTEARLAGT